LELDYGEMVMLDAEALAGMFLAMSSTWPAVAEPAVQDPIDDMVYMAHSCGSLCGGRTHHLLEKVEGVWREAKIPGVSNCMWAS
jgi:hypothetical protein